MIRDKAWLTNEIEIMGSETSENYPHEQMVDREVVLNLIEQLDEPEKVVIPEFVADWISQAKKWEYSISDSMGHVTFYDDTTQYDKAMRWARYNQNIFARAWLDGYEIEKESLYFISFPTPNRGNINMWRNTDTGSYYFAKSSNLIIQDGYKCAFTEKEIKSIDPRYWLFAEPVEESDDI